MFWIYGVAYTSGRGWRMGSKNLGGKLGRRNVVVEYEVA